MEFLTSTILSGIVWDEIKKFGKLSGEYIKKELREWILDEKTCEIIAQKINHIPDEYKKSQKFLEAAIDEDVELTKLLNSTRKSCVYSQNNSGSFINGSNVVNGNNNNTNINNFIQHKKKAEVKIINIDIERDGDNFPTLDIKFRNIGDEVAFLKKVIFNISDFYEMINPNIVDYRRIEESYTYDVLLDGFDKKQVSISQAISPNEVDRFRIKIANTLGDPEMPAIYRFSISAIYNEDNSCIESDEMVLVIPSLEDYIGSYTSSWSKQNARENYINLKRFNNENVYKCDCFIGIYNSYEQNKNDFM